MEKDWKTLSSKVGYNHPFFKVKLDKVKLPNGVIIDDYAVWDNADVAQTVPFRQDGRVALIRQFKQGAKELIVEFPGGFIEEGELPIDAAKRELLEETGLEAKKIISLTRVTHHPSKEVGSTYLFLATDVTVSKIQKAQDETEDTEVIWVTVSRLLNMIRKGEIRQSGTIVGIFLALKKLGLS